jgi:hypothetical protein
MANFISGVISLTIGLVVVASVYITQVKATNQTYGGCASSNGTATWYNGTCSWTAAETSLWGLLTLVGIAGILYGVLSVFGIA